MQFLYLNKIQIHIHVHTHSKFYKIPPIFIVCCALLFSLFYLIFLLNKDVILLY